MFTVLILCTFACSYVSIRETAYTTANVATQFAFPSFQYQFAFMISFCIISDSVCCVKEDNTYHNKVN